MRSAHASVVRTCAMSGLFAASAASTVLNRSCALMAEKRVRSSSSCAVDQPGVALGQSPRMRPSEMSAHSIHVEVSMISSLSSAEHDVVGQRRGHNRDNLARHDAAGDAAGANRRAHQPRDSRRAAHFLPVSDC